MRASGRVVGTVATGGYLASTRVALESWLAQHPGDRLLVLLVDADRGADAPWDDDRIEFITPADAGIDDDEFWIRATMYRPGELAMSLKPAWLSAALDRAERAVFLDSDLEFFAPLDRLDALIDEHGLLLTPHNLAPVPEDGLLPDRLTLLQSGVYNAGFVAVGRDRRDFVAWWGDLLARHCVEAPDDGIHADQRWLDLVPTLFPHLTVRDPTWNVAYWNLHERSPRWDGRRLLVEDRPVCFFHFSGLQRDWAGSLTRHDGGRPRIVLSDHPGVTRLARAFLAKVADAEATVTPPPSRLDLIDVPLDGRARLIYRHAVVAAETTGEPPPPHALVDGGRAFRRWVRSPAPGRAVPRYAARVWDESDVMQGLFPDPDGDDRDDWLRWLHHNGEEGAGVPPDYLPEDLPSPEPVEEPPAMSPPPEPEQPEPVALPDAADIHHRLDRPLDDGSASRAGSAGRYARRVVDHVLADRDQRADEVGRLVADAIGRLADSVAQLRLRLDDTAAEHHARLVLLEDSGHRLADGLVELSTEVAKDRAALREELEARLAELRVVFDDLAAREAATSAVVADGETHLSAELAELRAALDRLAPDPADGDVPDRAPGPDR